MEANEWRRSTTGKVQVRMRATGEIKTINVSKELHHANGRTGTDPPRILTFHNWGNGDFDCLFVGSEFPKDSIVFMSHSENKLVIVSDSLNNWFADVIGVIKNIGTLLHPLDYKIRGSDGIYKNILKQIDENDEHKQNRKYFK